MESAKNDILIIPIEKLKLSSGCIANMKDLEICSLQDFINKGWQRILEMENFDYIKFNEVIRYLNGNGLVYLLEKKD